ncbi:MAG TPA: hypothetical protein VFS44_12945 [Gemmatimonadaceae bacterium]|nr:hypothetical protein [Gemmatimonadaceae bacterium]
MSGGSRTLAVLCAGTLAVALHAHPAAAQATETTRDWLVTLGVESGWESNVRFPEAGDSGDVVTRASGGIAHVIQTPRSRLSLGVAGSAAMFRKLDDMNQRTYSLLGSASRQLTPRFTVGVNGAVNTNYSRGVTYIADAPVLLPLTLWRQQMGAGDVSYTFSPTLTGTANGSWNRVTFDSPLLVGGSTVRAQAGLTRRYASDASIGFTTQFERNITGGQTLDSSATGGAMLDSTATAGETLDSYSLLGEWMRRYGRLELHLRAGAVVNGSAAEGAARVLPAAGAELTQRRARGSTSLRYEHSVTQAYGLGRLVSTDQVALATDVTTVRGFTFRVDGGESWSSDPSRSGFQYTLTSLNAGIQQVVLSDVALGLAVFLRRAGGDYPHLNSYGVRATLNFAGSAGRIWGKKGPKPDTKK